MFFVQLCDYLIKFNKNKFNVLKWFMKYYKFHVSKKHQIFDILDSTTASTRSVCIGYDWISMGEPLQQTIY